MKKTTFLKEEKNSTVLFLLLFYVVFLGYDILYYGLFPHFPWLDTGSNSTVWYDFMYVKYCIILGLISFSIYLIKRNKTEFVKYIIFFGYFFTNLFSDILYYKDSTLAYTSGNLVEVVLILFSPIFVSKKFTYYVTLGVILKYILVGLFIKDPVILFPIIVNIILALISFILLHRFLNYII